MNRRNFLSILSLSGLAAICTGCAISGPLGNGRGTLYMPQEVLDGVLQGNLLSQNNDNHQGNSTLIHVSGPLEATQPLGKTRFSYPCLDYTRGVNLKPKDLLQKRQILSLLEIDEVVYFGTSWYSNSRKRVKWVLSDEKGRVLKEDSELNVVNRGDVPELVPIKKELLEKAGSMVKFENRIRYINMPENTFDKDESDLYWVRIVPR